MKRKLLVGLASALLLASPASAFEPFVVKDIRLEGIQRTEAGTVFSYLPVRVGETFDEAAASEAIRGLYATGFFSDVSIDVEDDVIVVRVSERPAIADIRIIGARSLGEDALKEGLRQIGLAETQIFDRALLERAEQEIKRQYLARGQYGAEVTTTVTPLERNRVGINFTVDEGAVAKIRDIRIVGNKAFKTKELLNLFQLTTPGWLTWYTKNDQYSRQKLSGDLEVLRSFYLDRGYLDFNIDSTQVSISPDKQDIFITLNITEGNKYTVSALRFAGDLILPEEEYLGMAQLKPGDVFSREKLTNTTKAVTDRLGNEGYAFANVNAAPEVDTEKNEVAFTVFVDPGRRVYVNRINIGGNTRTRDEVIRREMRQMEGEWYDASKIARSRDRVDRLGFFDSVTVQTPPVPDATDQVDVNVTVKEQPTGSIQLGAGFSSSDKLMLTGSFSQHNVFGTGKSMSITLDTSKSDRTISLSFTDPYYTPDGISVGYDIYHRTYDPSETIKVSRYKTVSTGAGIRLGYPIAEDDQINFGLTLDRTTTETYEESPILYKDFCRQFGCSDASGVGEVSLTSLIGSIGWRRDTRDSALYPRKGTLQRVSFEGTIPVGDLRYIKGSYQHQYWLPLRRLDALMFNVDVGWAEGFGDKPMPFYKHFFAGGQSTVRGFDSATIGPKTIEGDAIGGTRRLLGNMEYFFPMPGSGSDRSFRLSTFVDAGAVWADGEDIDLADLPYSAGLGFFWSSPMGPLKFSIGYPLKKKDGDESQTFQFQLGTVF